MAKNDKEQIQSLRGVRDILPEDQPYWLRFEDVLRAAAARNGYERITLPTIEKSELFKRGVGQGTDIVEKEMYEFEDKGDRKIALRPELTAGTVRAYIENGMRSWAKPVKLYYYGQVFRYDKPQAGRFREFYQGGFEIFAEEDPMADARLIQTGYKILKELGLEDITIKVNSLGSAESKEQIIEALREYISGKFKRLPKNDRGRYRKSPLMILDSDYKTTQKILDGFKDEFLDALTDDDREHFMSVLELLDELEIPYELDTSLVRGLDYYTGTVFEYFAEGYEDIAVASGGRYDTLVRELGGKDETPALGMGFGVDRVIEAMKEQNVNLPTSRKLDIFVAQLGETGRGEALKTLDKLEDEGYRIAASMSKGSLRAQLDTANRWNVPITLIIGEKEVHEEEIIVKDMEEGSQERIPDDELLDVLEEMMEEKRPEED